MCTIFFAYKVIDTLPLLVAANRDEFYARPTQSMHFWSEAPHLLAGRDLLAGGTWLGISTAGNLAMVTNFRDPGETIEDPLSRGQIPERFLREGPSVEAYLQSLMEERQRYRGFNVIFGSVETLYYYSNRTGQAQRLEPGFYGLSNHLLNTPWPKVTFGLETMKKMGTQPDRWSNNALLGLLKNQEKPPDHQLPDTGVGLDWERLLSSIFISSPIYGTRQSTILKFMENGGITVQESLWRPGNKESLESAFNIPPPASPL